LHTKIKRDLLTWHNRGGGDLLRRDTTTNHDSCVWVGVKGSTQRERSELRNAREN
jgi:hypothetical protein